MTLKIWARTLLTVQKYLERICNSIDACIEKKAMASSFVNSKNMYNNDCASVADWIINMSERKKQLINLNVICISALKGIERNFAKILALKYFCFVVMENPKSRNLLHGCRVVRQCLMAPHRSKQKTVTPL